MRISYQSSFAQSIASNFDYLFQRINDAFLHVNPRTFIDIASVEDDNTLVMRDGTLLTAVKIHGSTRDILYDEYVEVLNSLESSFRSLFLSGEHYFSFTFKSDSENVDSSISRMWTSQALETAKKLELDLQDIILEMHRVYADRCHDEEVYILVWTNVHALSKPEQKLFNQEKALAMNNVPRHAEAQSLIYTSQSFFEKHKATCDQIVADLLNISINASIEKCSDFLRSLRINIDEAFTDDNWMPKLIGSPISLRLLADNQADLSGIFQAPIPEQLMPRQMEQQKEGVIRCGDVLLAPLSLEQHPQETQPFDALFKSVSKLKIPFRMHMLLRNDGMGVFGMKVALSRLLSFTGSEKNKKLLASYDSLKQLQRSGEEIVSSQITFCTWSRNLEDLNEIRKRKNSLAKAISSWGSCQVSQAEGDEAESLLSTIGGLTLGSVAPAAGAPLYDAIKMAPIARVGSAWTHGSKLFRTATGKLIPYMPYSKQQLAWVKYIVGPMGSGKTVHLNGEHFALLLHPDNDELPYILNIDIGPGMKGFCDMIRDALPKHKKHQVVYEKLLNRSDKSINCFDTPLGLRYPLSTQRAFLESYLDMLCCPDNASASPDGTIALLSSLIDLVYSYRAKRETARRYSCGMSPRVDDALRELKFDSHNPNGREITWFDVTDFLASKGESHIAGIAQRFASPTIEDFAAKVSDPRLKNSYKKDANIEMRGDLCDYVQRKLNEAIRKYPIISGYTKFEIDGARIVSLDLDEVAKGVGSAATRKLSLMYFIAYYTLTKRIFTGKEHLDEMQVDTSGLFPFDYTEHHRKQIASIERTPKRFSGDEIHRFENDPIAKALQALSVREGRKWKVDIIQASQLPEDFDPKLIKLATDLVILGRGNQSNVEFISQYFGLPSNLKKRLGSNSMRKPSSEGATIITTVETDKARYEQFLISMYGPSFLWATTSTRDDTIVRDSLSGHIGTFKARSLLVELYPEGNLDKEIDDRRRRAAVLLNKNTLTSDVIGEIDQSDETPTAILEEIVSDALKYYEKRLAA